MRKIIFSVLFFIGLQSGASETIKGVHKDFNAFKQEMSGKLDSIEKKLGELKHKAKDKGHNVKEETVQELEKTRDELRSEVSKLGDDSKDNWKKLKKKLSESVDTLSSKIQNALKD